MATVKFYESTLSDVTETKKVRAGRILRNIVEEFVTRKDIVQTVEVYFPDEDITKHIPLESDVYDAIVIVNGNESNLDYKVQANDDIVILISQHDSETGAQVLGVIGIGLAFIAGMALIAVSGGSASPAVILGWSTLFASGIGLAIAGFSTAEMFKNMKNRDSSSELGAEHEGLLGINGGNNEPIIDKNYPLVLGKHLINPYIIGSPYHETYNRSVTGNYEGNSNNMEGLITQSRGYKDYYGTETADGTPDDLKYDHFDDGQYFKALYCAGYGPLKLTDFKIGDIRLAYNRCFKSKGMDAVIEEIEKLQKGGSIDVLKRPVVPSRLLKDKGWDIEENSYATLYSYAYPHSGSGYTHYLNVSPIVCDKNSGEFIKVLSEAELLVEAEKIYQSCDKETGTFTDELGIVLGPVLWVSKIPIFTIFPMPGQYITDEVKTVVALEKTAKRLHELSDIYTKRVLAATVMHGVLSGTSEDDTGDILRKWKNNDVQLEILQGGDIIQESNKWSSIYPFTVKEDSVDAPVLFAHDNTIKSNADIVYKGVSVPCGYRTNSVRFSKSCPHRIEVELDMPQGLYGTYTHNDEDSGHSNPFYTQIPINVAVQWRFAKQDEDSSNAESPEGWNTFDYELLNERNKTVDESGKEEIKDTYVRKYPIKYTQDVRRIELEQNKGLSPETITKHDNNEEWVKNGGADVFELSSDLCNMPYTWNTISTSEEELEKLKNDKVITYKKVTYKPYHKAKIEKTEERISWTSLIFGFPIFTTVGTGEYYDGYLQGFSLPYYEGMFNVHYQDEGATYTDENGHKVTLDSTSRVITEFSTWIIEKGESWDDEVYEIQYNTLPSCYDKDGHIQSYTIPSSIKRKVVTEKQNKKYKKDKYNVNERRYVFVKEFSAEECQKLLDINGEKSEFFDSIEVRVVRLTPCYINEVESKSKVDSGMTYEDLVKWTYIRTWSFDKEAYTSAVEQAIQDGVDPKTLLPSTYGERPIPAEDLNKFCFIALSLKQDIAETGGSSLEKLSCIATSYQPTYDMFRHMWTPSMNPETGEISEMKLFQSKSYYYTSLENDNKKRYIKLPISDLSDDIFERQLFTKLGFNNIEDGYKYSDEYQYNYGLTTEYANMFFSKDDGNDYHKKVRSMMFEQVMYYDINTCYPGNNPLYNVSVPRLFLSPTLQKRMETQNTASAAIYSLIGNHLKGDAKTLDSVELNAFGDFYEFCNDVTDGSLETYKSPNVTYPEWFRENLTKVINNIKSDNEELIGIIQNAPVNAVWRGCYDYAVNELLIRTGTPDYYKQEFIKYLEDNDFLAEADGKLHIQYNCNGVISSQIKLESLFQSILVTGRAYYRRSENNKYEPVIGRKDQYPVTVINQRNCLNMSNVRNFEEGIAGFNITYIDENDNYEQNNIYVMDDGESEKCPTKKIQQFKINYVTNALQMRSLARFNLASVLYQKEQYSRSVGILGYSLNFGDVVLLQDDTLLVGTDRGGRIKEILRNEGNNTIVGFVSDEPFNYKGELDDDGLCDFGCSVVQPKKYGYSRCVTIRCATPEKKVKTASEAKIYELNQIYYTFNNNKYVMASPQPSSQSEIETGSYFIDVKEYQMLKGTTNLFLFENPIYSDTEMSLDSEIDGTFYTYSPELDDLLAFGKVGSITTKAVIMGIKPKEKGTFDLSLSPYNEKLYEYGEKFPFFKSNMTSIERDTDSYNFTSTQTTSERVEDISRSQNLLSDNIMDVSGAPDKPTIGLILARKDYIQLSCIQTGTSLKDSVKFYEWQITKNDGKVKTLASASNEIQYLFDRDVDGYLESDTLKTWRIKVRVQNIYGNYSEWTDEYAPDIQSGNYTWIPSSPTVNDIYANRDGFKVRWNFDRNLGSSKFCVIIKKENVEIDRFTEITGNEITYNFNRNKNKDWYPEVSDLSKYSIIVRHYNEAYSIEDTTGVTTKGLITEQYLTWKPSKPTIITSPLVTKDGFTVEWDYTESYDIGEGKFVVEVTDGNGLLRTSEVVVGNSYNYIFNRSTDGYPEATKVNDNRSLADYSVTVKHYNDKYGLEDAAVSEVTKLNTALYKTWIPSKPTVTTSAVDKDGFTIDWSAEEIYDLGEAKYKVEVYYRNDDDTATKLFTKDNISNNQLQYNFVRSVDGYPEKEPVTIGDKNVLGLNRYYVKVYHSNNVYSMSDATVSEGASLNTSEYGTWIPSKPNVKDIIARRDGFVINWGYASNYGDNNFEVTVGKVVDDVFTPIQPTVKIEGYSYNYTFNRELDKYPEIEDLEKYLVKVQCNNEVYKDLDQAKTEKTVDTDGYGTWKLGAFGQNNINIDVMDRTVLMTLSTASMPNIEYYGETKYEISIKRIGITKASVEDVVPDEQDYPYPVIEPDENFYKPNLYGSPLSNELDYRTDEVDGYITSNYKYSQTLPLVGQKTKNISNTRYRYKIRAVNEAGYETDYQEVEITALCTSIRDIVKANENYKNLYVTKLSALNANVGLISQGGFGSFSSWSNFWALSSMTAEDAGTDRDIKRGAFRVGDNNQYIAVVPPHSSFGEGESLITNDGDYYKVVINAGNITLATDETSFDGGTYVYDKDDSSKRMKLSSSGLEMQLYNPVTNNYETKATFNADTNGNLTISNSAADSDELPKNGIKVDEDSIIYHLENDTKDTNGGNAGNFTFIPNTDNPFSESNLIKGKNKAYDGTISKTSKAEDICVFTNSDSILIGEHRVDIKDSSMSVDGELKYWNELFGKTFIWEK